MRSILVVVILAAMLSIAEAGEPPFKVGIVTRDVVPAEPFDWRGAKVHALRTTIWYPASPDARERAQWVGPPLFSFYSAGSAAPDAPLADGGSRPLVVLSHGFGGTASDLGWLGTALAAHGYVVAAVDHPGNTALDTYTVEGTTFMWLRAVDLRAVIDALLVDATFGAAIDHNRIGAAGHSLGGYTAITAAGGTSDPARLDAFCASPARDALCQVMGDFADLQRASRARRDTDPAFRELYRAAGHSYRDPRIRAVFAMAPGPGPLLVPASLAAITIPVAIVSGNGDGVTPPSSGARALAKSIPQATLTLFPHAGHFVFFGTCTATGRLVMSLVCVDRAGVERDAIHAETIALAVRFFASALR